MTESDSNRSLLSIWNRCSLLENAPNGRAAACAGQKTFVHRAAKLQPEMACSIGVRCSAVASQSRAQLEWALVPAQLLPPPNHSKMTHGALSQDQVSNPIRHRPNSKRTPS